MTRIFAVLTALFLGSAVVAQHYPERLLPGLNDLADMVDPDTETRIDDKLADIFQTHGVDVSVLTLSSVRFYAQDTSIEDYAKNLFNTWAIGDAEDSNGVLILVFRDDNELRVEIGSGYDESGQKAIDRVVDEDILPNFRAGNFSDGIEAGVDGLLARLIDPPTENSAPPSTDSTSEGSGNTLYYIIGGVVAAIAGLVGLNRRNAAKLAATPCTNCAKTGLQKSREVLRAATLEAEGQGEVRLTCPSCGHVVATPYTIAKLKPEAPKGGGKSDGDGATGTW